MKFFQKAEAKKHNPIVAALRLISHTPAQPTKSDMSDDLPKLLEEMRLAVAQRVEQKAEYAAAFDYLQNSGWANDATWARCARARAKLFCLYVIDVSSLWQAFAGQQAQRR
jgi:hypothetical protein